MKPKRRALRGQPAVGARRAEVELGGERWRLVPGGATHFGFGLAANRRACSASERKALVIDRDTPVARSRPRPSGRRRRPRPGASACPGGRRAGRHTRRRSRQPACPTAPTEPARPPRGPTGTRAARPRPAHGVHPRTPPSRAWARSRRGRPRRPADAAPLRCRHTRRPPARSPRRRLRTGVAGLAPRRRRQERGLEQARVAAPHRGAADTAARSAARCCAGSSPDRLAERQQHEHAGQRRRRQAEREDERLARLGERRRRAPAGHVPASHTVRERGDRPAHGARGSRPL